MEHTKTPVRTGAKKRSKAPAQGNTQLEHFFLDALKDIYWAEKIHIKALIKMQRAATTAELKTTIEKHLKQSEEQIIRLEEAFAMLGKTPQAKKCEAMEALINEGVAAVEATEKCSMTRDVAIIATIQKIKHYEIATYGTLVCLANAMGSVDLGDLLVDTLDEEQETDRELTMIAENRINWWAEQELEHE